MKTKVIKRKKIKWEEIVILLLFLWIIYSLCGVFFGAEYKKENGNICKGYQYGIKLCRGDINLD